MVRRAADWMLDVVLRRPVMWLAWHVNDAGNRRDIGWENRRWDLPHA